MFKLFGKKQEEPKPAPEKNPELAALGAQFEAEEITILAVTGPNAFRGSKGEDDQLWRAGMDLTAWVEEDGDAPVVRAPARLVTLADDKLMTFLRQRTPRDGIIRAKVRRSKKDDRFLLVDIPEPAMEPELKAILEEQKKPVTASDPELGIFLLDRSADWFAAEKAWLSQTIQLTFDRTSDREGCFGTARTLFTDPEGWDARARDFAAGQLLEQANDWAEEAGEPVTREQFMARLELESIHVLDDGSFEMWFGDGELFWGHSIHLLGDLTNGPTEARMEG